MALKPCLSCGKEVREQDAFCWNCGHARTPTGAAAAQSPAPSSQSNETPMGLVFGVVGFLSLLLLIGTCSNDSDTSATTAAADVAKREAEERRTDSTTAFALAQRDGSLSRADAVRLDEIIHRRGYGIAHAASHRTAVDVLLDSASALLKPNTDGWGAVTPAREVLAAVREPMTEKQADRKATLTARADRQFKLIEASAAKAAAKLMVDQRKEMARRMETSMLDGGVDASFTTRGKDATTLHVKYILIGRVFVHQFTKEGEMLSNLRKAGFKKVILTDGYDETWTINLE